MNKKSYNKPLLVTREIDLGVFGDYTDCGPGGGHGGRGGRRGGHGGRRGGHGFWREALPIPVANVGQLNLRME